MTKQDIERWQATVGVKPDGDFGPKTLAASLAILPRKPLHPKRQAVIDIALSQVGKQDPDKYWSEVCIDLVGSGKAWCGGFALWCLRQAGVTNRYWLPRLGFVYQKPQLRATLNPETGDIAYIDQPYQHYALVVNVVGETIYTIDGNQAGETVSPRERERFEFTSFYSIESLL